jgi:uncharacterized protein
MTKLVAISLAALAFVLLNLASPARAEGRVAGVDRTTRIVIQINEDDSKKWHSILGNVRNIQADLGKPNVRIALVVIGPGLGMLMADSLAANDAQDAIAAGVEVVACGNSMKAQKVRTEDMVEGIGVAQAGYVEIVRRQQAGWSYLRP